MNKSFFQTAEKLNKEHQRTRRWHKVITIMAAIVVFCTTYALILPAITWERHLLCDTKEHTHTVSCYAEVVVTPEARELTCSVPEHVHGDSCYEEVTTYVCGLEASDEHQHTADCMQVERIPTCEQSEHTHGDSCYHITPAVTERQLVCTKPEHVHTDACFDAPPSSDSGYCCGYAEHTHNENCYFEDGSLRCTMKEHTHTLSCKINKNADLETATEWERTFADVKLGDNWAQNVLDIADTQLGYAESAKNFVIDDEKTGAVRGYSRYGAWYGDPYGDWCAMFASFCIDYAGVKDFPLESNCGKWIEALSDKDCLLYHPANSYLESYMPHPGDLIFFDWDAQKQAKAENTTEDLTDAELAEAEAKLIEQATHDVDHVGLVYELIEATDTTPAQIKTIEGNNGNVVAYHTYDLDDVQILGYGQLPENPDYLKLHEITSDPASDGAIVTISGKLPADAKATIQTVKLSEKQLNTYMGEDKASAINSYIAYDIKIMVNGEEWQPIDPVSVQVKNPNLEVKNSECLAAAHVDDVTHVVSDVEKPVGTDDAISFTADGFSTYIFYTFTVDFHYGEVTFSIEGRTEITLSELFAELGITRSVADVVDVTFSDESLVKVTKTENDWILTSLEPFNTNESLIIRFADGETYILGVTDAQTTYWKRVSSLDQINANDTYMIVNKQNNKLAIGVNSSGSYIGTAANMTAVSGHDGYFTTTLGNEYWWKFSGSGSAWKQTNVAHSGYGIRLRSDSTPVGPVNGTNSTSSTTNTLSDQGNSTWRIRQDNYYLYDNGTKLVSGAAKSNRDSYIYVQVDDPTATNGTVKSGTGNSTKYTFDVYLQQVDDFGHALGIPVKIGTQAVDSNRTKTNNPIVPSALFTSYGVNGTYVDAYYGTASAKDKDDVKSIYRYTSNNNYYLGVTYGNNQTTDTYLNASSEKALYIQYRVDSGGDVPPPAPDSAFEHNKYIDALRDNTRNADNPDTDLDNNARSGQLPEGVDAYDLYRLYLDMTGKQEPMDLLVVVDESSSMLQNNDMTGSSANMRRDHAVTEFLNGSTSKSNQNGFLAYFLGLNPENKVSVVSFYGANYRDVDSNRVSNSEYPYTNDSDVLLDWTQTNSFVDCTAKETNGTNYEAGLRRASQLFQSDTVKNDGHRKIMIFLSDGVPTFFQIDENDVGTKCNNYTIKEADVGKRWGNGTTNNNNYPYCKDTSKQGFDDFMKANPYVNVFAIGVSKDINETNPGTSQSPEVLQYMATEGHGAFFGVTSDMAELKLRLESIFYPAGVTITDYLSKYVRYYSEDPDVLVTMTSKTDGTVTKLYENGAVTEEGKGILTGVTFNRDGGSQAPTGDYSGIVKAIFASDYKFQPDYTYTLSFNVQTTQTAYDEYAANIAAGQNAYGGVTGDEDTDYPKNTTSSQKPGFHSNNYADVIYNVSGASQREEYVHPVIQVKETHIDVEKVWSDGADKHDADKIEAELYMVNGTDEMLITSVELNKDNAWKATFTNLPAGSNTYKVVEKDDPNNPILTDYDVDYKNTPATGTANEKWTITNTRKTTKLTLYKVDMEGEMIVTDEATFELYDSADLTNPKTYTTTNGVLTITDLAVGQPYWLKEAKSPDGYYRLEAAQEFKVNAEGEVIGIDTDIAHFQWDNDEQVLKVYNTDGYELPESGGSGLIPIYACGMLLIAGVLMYGYSTRRKRERRHSN